MNLPALRRTPPINYNLVLLFLFTTACAVLLVNAKGTGDVQALMTWNRIIEQHGLVEGYIQSGADYPPLSVIMVALAAQAAPAFHLTTVLGLKFAILGFLLLTTLGFYLWTQDLLLTSVLQAAFLLNSMALGYIDVFFAPVLLAGLLALERRRLGWAAGLVLLSCLIKWQVIIIVPFVLVYLVKLGGRRAVLTAAGLTAAASLVLLVIFQQAVPLSFWYALTRSTYLSGTALNANWVLTYLLHVFDPAAYGPLINGQSEIIVTENLAVTLVPKLLFVAGYGYSLLHVSRGAPTFPRFLLYTILGYLAYFTFNTGVHENHLFLACLLLAVLAWRERAYLADLLAWAAVFNANMLAFYGLDGQGLPFSRVVLGLDITVPLAVLVVLMFLGFLRNSNS